MSYSTEYLENGRGVLHVGRGIVTGAEVLEAAVAFRTSDFRDKGVRYGIVDLSEATDLHIGTDELRRIATENKKTSVFIPHGAVAIVANNDLAFGLARMWQVFVEDTGWSVEVFRSRKEALDWVARSKR